MSVKHQPLVQMVVRIAGFILLAAIAYYTVEFSDFLNGLKKLSLPAIAILLFLGTVDRFIMAYKWHLLCQALGMTTPFHRYLSIYYVSTFIGYTLPTSMGAEVYRVARLGRTESGTAVFASMFMERLVGAISNIFFAWGGALYLSISIQSENMDTLFTLLIGSTILVILVTIASFHPSLHRFTLDIAKRLKFGLLLQKFTTAYAEFGNQKRALITNIGWGIIETGLQLIMLTGVAVALQIELSITILLAIIGITEFIRRVAIILDGWGLATALQLFMYGLVGLNGAEALLIALLGHALLFFSGLPGGLILLLDRWEDKHAHPEN